MKPLKFIDLVLVSMFMIGLLAGFIQIIHTETAHEVTVSNSSAQDVSLIEPERHDPLI